mmetsp:Transcript_32058/g.92073  ORF Transcript_32058/g.92073 Transcript_32058/m.92073 type:complete len:242 (+) Transcript_32058:47-772(+)
MEEAALPAKRKRAEEGAPITHEGGPPAWLTGQFPDHASWSSWRSCCVRVDSELGAGLDLEATSSGYRVESLEGAPRQPEELRPGALIVSVDGFPLFGLAEEALEEAFGSRFKDGARLEMLDWEEFCTAEAERDAADDAELEEIPASGAAAATFAEEVSEEGRLLRQPLGARVVRTLAPGDRERLEGDLRELGRKTGAVAELLCPPCADMDSVALRGEPEAIQEAKSELLRILAFYGVSLPD